MIGLVSYGRYLAPDPVTLYEVERNEIQKDIESSEHASSFNNEVVNALVNDISDFGFRSHIHDEEILFIFSHMFFQFDVLDL